MAFADRLFRKRNPLETIIGIAGGNLEDQIQRDREGAIPRSTQEQQRPIMLTPQNQESITRPRRTYNTTLSPVEEQQFEIWKQQNAPNDSGQDYDLRGAFKAGVVPNADRHWPDTFKKPNHPTFSDESQYAQGADAQRAGTWQGETFKPSPFAQRLLQPSRERRTQPRDFVADDTQYLRELESKPLSWRDKAGMVSQVVARSLGGQPLPTRRERALAEAQGTLGRDIAIEKQKLASEQGQMIPVTLSDGSTVMAPARTAGGLQSQQQGFSVRRQQIEDHRKRWEQMGAHEAAQDAQKLFNSGAADDNDDLKDEVVRRMGLPPGTRLPNHDKGQVQVDDAGNFILINPRSGEVRPALRPQTEGAPQSVGSMQGTTEKGRQRRFEQGEAGKDRRVGVQQAGADRRAAMRGAAGATTDRAAVRRAAELVGKIESARQAIAAADERLKRDPNNSTAKRAREEARIAGEGWATELNALNAGYEAGAGAQGYPYYKKSGQQQAAPQSQGGQYAGKRISKANVAEYGRRHQMSKEEAEEFLRKEGATIY